ncbi:MAG TPA: hypothetical protein VMB25_22100 [Bryobacteraceae bacterium]|nr:hypothetical protein [Bryobacteraceae bacterium]
MRHQLADPARSGNNQLTGLNNGAENPAYNYPTGTNNGEIASKYNAVSGETVTYAYDSRNHLASAGSGSTWGEAYTYDGFGNLTAKTVTARPGSTDPQSWNRYGYTRGDPVNRLDPNGDDDFSATYGCTVGAGEGTEIVDCFDVTVFVAAPPPLAAAQLASAGSAIAKYAQYMSIFGGEQSDHY